MHVHSNGSLPGMSRLMPGRDVLMLQLLIHIIGAPIHSFIIKSHRTVSLTSLILPPHLFNHPLPILRPAPLYVVPTQATYLAF